MTSLDQLKRTGEENFRSNILPQYQTAFDTAYVRNTLIATSGKEMLLSPFQGVVVYVHEKTG